MNSVTFKMTFVNSQTVTLKMSKVEYVGYLYQFLLYSNEVSK